MYALRNAQRLGAAIDRHDRLVHVNECLQARAIGAGRIVVKAIVLVERITLKAHLVGGIDGHDIAGNHHMATGCQRVEIWDGRLVLAPPQQQGIEIAVRIDVAGLLHKGFLRVDTQQVLLGAQRAPDHVALAHRIGLPDHKQARLRRLDGNGARRPRRILRQAQQDAYRERLARAQRRIALTRGIGPRVDAQIRKRGEFILGAGKIVQAVVVTPMDVHGTEQRPSIEHLSVVDRILHG